MFPRILFVLLLASPLPVVFADNPPDPAASSAETTSNASSNQDTGPAPDKPKDDNETPTSPGLELADDVKQILEPFFQSIAGAEVSRATVELSAESIVNGAITDSQTSSYQIASKAPGKFTVYLKEPNQRTRIFCDGESITVAVAPDAYFPIDKAISLQDAVMELPIVLGPYPEPLLALSLAGVDPALSLLAGMQSVELV